MDTQWGRGQTYSTIDSLHSCPTNIAFCKAELRKTSSRSKRMTVHESQEVILLMTVKWRIKMEVLMGSILILINMILNQKGELVFPILQERH